MRNKVMGVIMALPELDIKPTMNNVKIMDAIYNTLLEINDELEAEERVGTNEQVQNNSNGRDGV